jgi:hypothetical protein
MMTSVAHSNKEEKKTRKCPFGPFFEKRTFSGIPDFPYLVERSTK